MPTTDPIWRDALSQVGEIVLLASALDHQVTQVVIEALHLTKSPMLEPVVATLDSSRKLEILKGRARHIKQGNWKKPIEKYVDLVERVNRARNIACHSQIYLDGDKFVFTTSQAAKLFKGLKLEGVPTVERVLLESVANTIKIAEQALGDGADLIKTFQKLQAELDRRKAEHTSKR
jgi:hypothetical protein